MLPKFGFGYVGCVVVKFNKEVAWVFGMAVGLKVIVFNKKEAFCFGDLNCNGTGMFVHKK